MTAPAIDRTAHQDMARVEDLVLYGYPQCPFCRRVMGAAASLGIELELRNTLVDDDHQQALVDATGRSTVPVLRIEGEDGEERWMPESADIVEYLEKRFRDRS